MRILFSGMIAALALAGCTYEAGYEVDTGDFGNATLNNVGVMNGEISYAANLGNRFASEVPNTVNFAFDSDALDATAQQVLRQQASWIKQFPEVRFRVYGYTDAVGTPGYNRGLGKRRADAVVRFLSRQGINRSRLEAVESFGETQPLIDTPNRERRNRRAITEVTGFVKRHPTVMDGKYAQIIYREYLTSAEPQTGLSGITGEDLRTGQ